MKQTLLKEIIELKNKKKEFAIITNLLNGNSCIFENDKPINKDFKQYSKQINNFFQNKKNGVIENTDIFVESYIDLLK